MLHPGNRLGPPRRRAAARPRGVARALRWRSACSSASQQPLDRSSTKETAMKKSEKNEKKLTLRKLTIATLTKVTGGQQDPCTGQCSETSRKNSCMC
jgi:hypothetical protein